MPKQVDHDERRRELARAAHRVAAQGGLDALTVRAIAREAGYSTGVLAHYFSNRADLLLAAFREVFDDAMSRAQARVESAGNSVDALLEVLMEALPLDEKRRADTSVWFAFLGLAAGDPVLQREGADRYRRWRGLLLKAVVAAHPEPVAPGEAEHIARYLAALVAGFGVQALCAPGKVQPDDLRREFRRAVLLKCGIEPMPDEQED